MWRFQSGDVALIFTEFACLENTSHDLAAAGVRQVVDELDLARSHCCSQLAASMAQQLTEHFVGRLGPFGENHECLNDGASGFVGFADHAGLGHRWVFVQRRLDLERAITALPTGYRSAFILHDVEGYEHREVAEMLGIAVGTSKSQVHKARLRLRTLLRRT